MICKGTAVIFELANGEDVKPPASYAMLHDPKGREWPARSLLVGPFTRGNVTRLVPLEAVKYLGKSHRIHQGSATLPPRTGWRRYPGEVAVLFYKRGGTRAPGKMRHQFGKLSVAKVLMGHGKARLSRCGRWYRLDLPRGAVVDDRGIVWP